MAKGRKIVQIISAALSNGYIYGFSKGKLFSGRMKGICLPGLNCYSCPGALGACPLGSLQSSLASRGGVLYVVGFITLFGALFGRFVCGWLCPFGLLQELIHKIPVGRKLKKLPGDKALRKLKYALFVLLVVILPLFFTGSPTFCKYVCPQGTLEGGVILPLLVPALRGALHLLYAWKVFLLVAIVILSLFVYRPFCRYLCPLGMVYGAFNKVSVMRLEIDREKCTGCGRCRKACPMDIDVMRDPNQRLCIRCGACVDACPEKALRRHISLM